jgi:CCR4-NOT complex subunit CAF16
MHAVSDGERRRVQLCMGLMVPWDVLLLDEVSVLFSSGVVMC